MSTIPLKSFIAKIRKELPDSERINILIGTDCISEGQNLQDCDTVINYDIQWNPVSLIQRFGRIDRIGSTNKQINFFPAIELNEYLNLEQRIKGKMVSVNIASTGDEDVLKEFRKLSYGKSEVSEDLFNKFLVKTNEVRDMSFYSELLSCAVKSIQGNEEKKAEETIFDFGGFSNDFASETSDDFEIVSFLVVE